MIGAVSLSKDRQMIAIDFAEMPTVEKLQLMEALWDSLSRQAAANVESPAWHEQALKQAESEFAAGVACFVGWGDAKEQLRGRRQV